MGPKRKLKTALNSKAKHRYSLRSKSKCRPFELENFCARFPKLSEDIFKELDCKSLIKFRETSNFWNQNIRDQRVYWIKKIQQCTESYTEFRKEWNMVARKTPICLLKTIEIVTRGLTGK